MVLLLKCISSQPSSRTSVTRHKKIIHPALLRAQSHTKKRHTETIRKSDTVTLDNIRAVRKTSGFKQVYRKQNC